MNSALLNQLNKVIELSASFDAIERNISDLETQYQSCTVPDAATYAKTNTPMPFSNTETGRKKYIESKIGPSPLEPTKKTEQDYRVNYIISIGLILLGVIMLFIGFSSIIMLLIIGVAVAIFGIWKLFIDIPNKKSHDQFTYEAALKQYESYKVAKAKVQQEIYDYQHQYDRKFFEFDKVKDKIAAEVSERRKTISEDINKLKTQESNINSTINEILQEIGLPRTFYEDKNSFMAIHSNVNLGRADSIKEAINIMYQDDRENMRFAEQKKQTQIALETATETALARRQAEINAQQLQAQLDEQRIRMEQIAARTGTSSSEIAKAQIEAQRQAQRQAGSVQCRHCQNYSQCSSGARDANIGTCPRFMPNTGIFG